MAATLARIAPFGTALVTVLLDALAKTIALTVRVQLRLVLMGLDQLLKVIFVRNGLNLVVIVLLWLLMLLFFLFVLEFYLDLLMLYFCLLELGTLFGRRGLLIMLSRTTSSLLLDLLYLL